MGSSQSQTIINVANLNYSGIYLNPFQYYGLDNWQELERIGRIFESQLKKGYLQIKEKRQQLLKDKKQDEQYSRKGFKWDVGDIDKAVHTERYSPLYTSGQNIERERFAGLTQNNELMTQEQFQGEWDKKFNSIAAKPDNKDFEKGRTAKPHQKFNCRTFDLLCYKSILLYLYTKYKDVDSKDKNSYKDNFSYNFKDIEENKSNENLIKNLIKLYKDFMKDYFSRIDVNGKINTTMDCLFHVKKSPFILTFAEGTPAFRKQLQKLHDQYYIYGPQIEKTKQTILMVKKNFPFLSSLPQNHQKESFQKKTMENIGREIKPYIESYLKYWNQRLENEDKSDKKDYQKKVEAKENFFKDFEKNQNIMKWTEDFVIIDYQQQKVLIGAFHFSSKGEVNPLQVQLFGLIITLWEEKGYKFIFSGDFNSHITTSEKQPLDYLFSFAKYLKKNISKNVSIYPKHPKIITTKKKRTILQPQFNKMNDLAQKCIDQVITNYKIIYDRSHVGEIKDLGSEKNNNEAYLPHKQHPYDHLLVEAIIDLQQPSNGSR